MPSIDYNEDIDLPGTSRSQFISLQNKGEKIRFRLANKAHFRGRHWNPKEKAPEDCPRINSDEYCEYCEKFESGVMPPEVKVDKKGKITEGRNWYKPSVQFLYPILNRDTGESQIFQTSLIVHLAIRNAAKAGVDVYKSDWQVERTEESPAAYYSVVRLDPIPLTKDDKATLEEAKEIDFEQIYKEETKESTMDAPEEEEEPEPKKIKENEEEKVDPDDIPL